MTVRVLDFDDWWREYCEFTPSDRVTHAARESWNASRAFYVGHKEQLNEIARLRYVLAAILQTACDADEEQPKTLLGEIADMCLREVKTQTPNAELTGRASAACEGPR
jgi:hypothetical protein